MSELEKLRSEINRIDNSLLDLLSNRMEISVKVGEYKKKNNIQVLDSSREKELIERLISYNNIDNDLVKDLWNIIMKYSKKLQN